MTRQEQANEIRARLVTAWGAPGTWDTDLQPWDADLQPWDDDLQPWDDADATPETKTV